MHPALITAAISIPTILLRIRSWEKIIFIVIALALYGLAMIFREKLRKYRTRNWPTTPGKITSIQPKQVSGGLNGVDYWKITFTYTWQVQQAHEGTYKFNCTSENMALGALRGLKEKYVSVHYSPSNEAKAYLWEDEVWDIWFDTYWDMTHPTSEAAASSTDAAPPS